MSSVCQICGCVLHTGADLEEGVCSRCRYPEAAGRIAVVLKRDAEIDRLQQQIYHALNALAVIHRDGGHHTAKVGFEQSCTDATDRVLEYRQEIERLKNDRAVCMECGAEIE